MRLVLAAAAAVLAAPGLAAGGPVGVRMGAPLEPLKPQRTATPGLFLIVPPERPPAPFDVALAVATPEDGVCGLVLVSPPRTFDAAGAGARVMFAHEERLLTEAYGPPTRIDRLRPGALLTQAADFAAALNAGQRELRADWSNTEGQPGDPDIAGIVLVARASDTDTTYLRVTYRFRNYGLCRARLNGLREARALLGR